LRSAWPVQWDAPDRFFPILRLERDRVKLVKDVRKLAVLRVNAIGDYLVSLPALEALRAAYPAAELVLLGSGWHADFLAGRPGPVDRCVPVPPTVGVRDDRPPSPPATVERFFARVRAERFDLAVQLQGGGRHSNPFVCRLGARVTAGSRAPDAPPLDRAVPYTGHQHEIHRFLEVADLVGATPVTLEPRLQVTAADRAEAAAALAGDDRPLVVLHPGANDPRRRWPVERLAVVGSELARKGARLAVVGTAADQPLADRLLADRLLATLEGDAADLTGRLGLGGLAGLLERASSLVGNDSGPRHLAAAVGTATVAVYWGVQPRQLRAAAPGTAPGPDRLAAALPGLRRPRPPTGLPALPPGLVRRRRQHRRGAGRGPRPARDRGRQGIKTMTMRHRWTLGEQGGLVRRARSASQRSLGRQPALIGIPLPVTPSDLTEVS
jgi:ADP-heptose:LPS heptosyltransferase